MTRLLMTALMFASIVPAADATYDGSRVHYESYGKGKEAIVFVHGWTCDLTFWRGQAVVYNKRRALLIDLPGHGSSDKPDVAYTPDRFARAVDAVMRDAGVDRAVIVGHSMGGPVAFTFLRLFPDRTKGLVLVDAFIPKAAKDDADRAAQKARMAPFARSFRQPNYKETALKTIDSMFSDKTTPVQRDEIRTKMISTPQHVMAAAMEGMGELEPPKPDEVYKVPVMVVMAARPDRVGYEDQLRTLFPNLKYEEWKDSGHFMMMESPDRFNRTLEDFLASIDTPKN